MADFEIPENPDFVESVRKFEPTDPAHADLFNRVILALLESLAYLRKYKADMDYVDLSYQQATGYADKIVAALINGAPEMLNTLDKLANAVEENASIIDVLVAAIGKKAEQVELDTHTGNNVIHITSAEHEGLTEAIKHTKTEHVTGVKGSAESIYRTGDVEITAENVGGLSLKNGGNVTGDTSFQGKRRVHYVDDGTGRAGYDKIARFTANSAYNNAAIEIELARRTDTVPTHVAIMFTGNACYAVTCMGHTKDIFMCKESDGVWVLYVKKTHEWCTTSVLDYVHSSFADGVTVEWIVSSSANYAESLPNTEIISGTWGYIVKEAMEAGNVNWNGITDKPSTYPPSDGSNNYVKVFNSSNVNHSDDLTVNDLADQGFAAAMIAATEDSPIGSGWFHVLNLGWDNSKNNWVSQIAFGTQPNDGLYYRTTGASIVGKPWKRALDSSNYTNYALKNENLSNVDLNNVTTTGIYHLAGNLVNNPESCNATLIVDFNVGTPYQLFIPDYNYRMYKRVKSNGNWSSWTSLFTWNNLEGKPVARKIDIVSNSTFKIENYDSNPVSIVQTIDYGEYITMGEVNMQHYRLLLCVRERTSNGIVAGFDITKDNKLLVPVTSANPEKIINNTSQNINLYFDIHFNYSENLGGWSWSWDDVGYITIYGGSGTSDFSTQCFFWVDCWAQ